MDLRLHRADDAAVLSGAAVVGDLDFSGGDIALVDGDEAILQHLGFRIRFFLGEWFLDTELGVPWYQKILGFRPVPSVVRAIFHEVTIETPGIAAVQELKVAMDIAARTMAIDLRAPTSSGTVLDYTNRFLIN